MFSKSERFYDELYEALGKDYFKETEKVHRIIQKYKRSKGNLLLDVACGTGTHAGYFRKYYRVEGLDIDSKMVAIARRKHSEIRFHRGDMKSFDLGREFDAVVCLFSSIGYVKTKANLYKAIKNMSRHLIPGGVLLVEPWFTSTQWMIGHIHTLHVSKPDLKITRMSHGGKKGKISTLDFQYLVGTKKGLEHMTEHHELGLFSHTEYLSAFHSASLKVIHDTKGLDGRGLYIGLKST